MVLDRGDKAKNETFEPNMMVFTYLHNTIQIGLMKTVNMVITLILQRCKLIFSQDHPNSHFTTDILEDKRIYQQ